MTMRAVIKNDDATRYLKVAPSNGEPARLLEPGGSGEFWLYEGKSLLLSEDAVASASGAASEPAGE